MTPTGGPAYVFDPGSLCLELLITGGPGEFARWEALHEPEDLAAWLATCGLRLNRSRIHVTTEELRAVRHTRDTLHHVLRALPDRPAPKDVALINAAAAHPPLVPRMSEDGRSTWAVPYTAAQALSEFARDAIDLLTGDHVHRVRECAAHDCRLLFVDTSRPNRRRWCSMDRCGNRAKVRALRERRTEDR